MSASRLTLAPPPPAPLSGAQLLGDVLDVITAGLPYLDPHDAARPALARLAPMLARQLGREPTAEVK